MLRQTISPAPVTTRAPAGWTSRHTAWLLFAPPALMVAARWLLQLATDRQGAAPALSLEPVSVADGMQDLLWPASLAVAVLLAAGLALRRLGWRRAALMLGMAWVLIWLAGSGAMLQRHLNRQGLFLQGMSASAAAPAANVAAQVVTSHFKPPSQRSLGGTELVLRVPGLPLPHRLLIDDAGAVPLKPGDTLALRLAPGRFNGLFVTGWQVAPPAAAPALPNPAMPAGFH
jgi:hypothetical protein